MRVRVLTFATAREAVGTSEIELEIADGSKISDLADRLKTDFPSLEPIWTRLAIALDGEITTPSAQLHDGAEIALLPPVSGGSPTRASLVDAPIDPTSVVAEVSSGRAGATVLFLGTVRESHRGRSVTKIFYDAYRPMALRVLERIASELETEDDSIRIHIVHRLGELSVGEASVAIVVASPHRAAAFRICQMTLERLKRETPIWKQEHYSDGDTTWREDESLAQETPLREPVGP
ncbi:MAG: molybdenum cofactor biosynthesis protein MoaE [Acidobacteriota bacterium]